MPRGIDSQQIYLTLKIGTPSKVREPQLKKSRSPLLGPKTQVFNKQLQYHLWIWSERAIWSRVVIFQGIGEHSVPTPCYTFKQGNLRFTHYQENLPSFSVLTHSNKVGFCRHKNALVIIPVDNDISNPPSWFVLFPKVVMVMVVGYVG